MERENVWHLDSEISNLFLEWYRANIYGVTRLGSRGKREVLRTLSNPRYNIVTRSKPVQSKSKRRVIKMQEEK